MVGQSAGAVFAAAAREGLVMPGAARTRRQSLFGRFLRRNDGATAVEFGVVALPFFWLMTALGEIAVMSMAQTNLNLAMAEMGRMVRTGQVQITGMSQAEVEGEVCDSLRDIMPLECDDRLFIDIETFDAFSDVDIEPPINNGEFDDDELTFDPGTPNDIVLVRGYYRWEVITPFFASIFSNVGSGDRLLTSAVAFRNEPWPVEP
jgi:Flp pilus assembly protein TadG